MISGHLQIKNGIYHAVLNYTDYNGKRHQKWISTEIPITKNKKKAENRLIELRMTYQPPKEANDDSGVTSDMLFSDYLEKWLRMKQTKVEVTTLGCYEHAVRVHIAPYFSKKGISLDKLKARDIQAFYLHEQEKGISGTSLVRMHAIIRNALKYAYALDLVICNEADKIERPKKNRYIANYLTATEIERLFEASKDSKIGLLIQMTAFYGFRREEIIGLKWSAVNFEEDTLTVRHIVTKTRKDDKQLIVIAERAKTGASIRTLPLVATFKEKLIELKKHQENNKSLCGETYNQEYNEYIFVDELGNLFKPDYVSRLFKKILDEANIKHVRFHDLRHSCASLMIKQRVPLKQIQEWLGHSNISTTSDIYAHLDISAKIKSAEAISEILKPPDINLSNW